MSRLGIATRVIDKKPHRVLAGHADGLESRTLEILHSFDVGDEIWKESNKTEEFALWVRIKSQI